MQEVPPPPQKKELPAPNEKLLKSPTFQEKYGKVAKWLVIRFILIAILLSASVLFLQPQKPTTPTQPPINKIEISADKKSILNAETKETILTIYDTQTYVFFKDSDNKGDIFGIPDPEYAGNCILDAALSNKKDRIVFSTECLPKKILQPQPWIVVYKIYNDYCAPNTKCESISSKENHFKPGFKLAITGGSGKNFIWSNDDKTIT